MANLNKKFQGEISDELIEGVKDDYGNFVVYDKTGKMFVLNEYSSHTRRASITGKISVESINELKLKKI